MSWQEDWVLPHSVESLLDAEILEKVRAILPASVELKLVNEEPAYRIVLATFAPDAVELVAAKLSERDGQLDWDWRADMDPPPHGVSVYKLHVELVDDERPILRVCSNDGTNREAWPLAFSLCSSLAEELGAIPEEDAPPPSSSEPSS